MRATLLVAVFASVSMAVFLPMILAAAQWKTEEEKARKRRMADHRMMARLLRLDI